MILYITYKCVYQRQAIGHLSMCIAYHPRWQRWMVKPIPPLSLSSLFSLASETAAILNPSHSQWRFSTGKRINEKRDTRKNTPTLPPALGFPRKNHNHQPHHLPQRLRVKNLLIEKGKKASRLFLSLSTRCLLFQESISFLPASSQSRKFPPRGTEIYKYKVTG